MNAQLEAISEITPILKTRIWDSVEYLLNEESIRSYIEATVEEAPDDIEFMAVALGNVARARILIALSRTTGIECNTLYKMTRGDDEHCQPTAQDVAKLAQALNIDLSAFPGPHAWAPHTEAICAAA